MCSVPGLAFGDVGCICVFWMVVLIRFCLFIDVLNLLMCVQSLSLIIASFITSFFIVRSYVPLSVSLSHLCSFYVSFVSFIC